VAIFVTKIIKVGGNLTKLWQKTILTVFRHGVFILKILNGQRPV